MMGYSDITVLYMSIPGSGEWGWSNYLFTWTIDVLCFNARQKYIFSVDRFTPWMITNHKTVRISSCTTYNVIHYYVRIKLYSLKNQENKHCVKLSVWYIIHYCVQTFIYKKETCWFLHPDSPSVYEFFYDRNCVLRQEPCAVPRLI